jgi:hypothetical protein
VDLGGQRVPRGKDFTKTEDKMGKNKTLFTIKVQK